MNIVLATGNLNKLREFQEILGSDTVTIISQSAFPDCPDVVEDGASFKENALKKARAIAAHTGQVTMADDSGLEVDALGGAPGIHSARYAGEPRSDERNIALLLDTMRGLPDEQRRARFRCVIALVAPGGPEFTAEGECRGRITTRPLGSGGFGYDPVFLHEPSGRTFAQIDAETKHSLSHRGRAARNLRELLPAFMHSLQQP